jgi:hypothetical protein
MGINNLKNINIKHFTKPNIQKGNTSIVGLELKLELRVKITVKTKIKVRIKG